LAALKMFLSFAQTGKLGIAEETGRDADSIFEEQVAARLTALGHDVNATFEDMESYEALWEEPLETVFLDHRIVVPGPSSAGGRQVLQALNLVEQLALHRMGPYWQDERAFRDLSRVLGFVVSQDRPEVTDALTRRSRSRDRSSRGQRSSCSPGAVLGSASSIHNTRCRPDRSGRRWRLQRSRSSLR
jgi:gamma-glutamyltranspeptidase